MHDTSANANLENSASVGLANRIVAALLTLSPYWFALLSNQGRVCLWRGTWPCISNCEGILAMTDLVRIFQHTSQQLQNILIQHLGVLT